MRFYVFEGFQFQLLYKERWHDSFDGSGIRNLKFGIITRINGHNRRRYIPLKPRDLSGFINHHIAGSTKALIFFIGLYPWLRVLWTDDDYQSPVSPGSSVTMGDMLIVATQFLMAIYIFEIIYRPDISPVSVAHHIGTIIIGQVAVALTLDLGKQPDAVIEYTLCLIWGKYSFFGPVSSLRIESL